MWIVRIALTRPYTFIVFALLLLILGSLAIVRTPKDIFPSINIPVVSVVWTYTGLLPAEMAGRITSPFERALPTTVNDIEHIESQSLLGVSVTKIFFHPNVEIGIALSQVIAIAQTILRNLPQGTQPPLVLSYTASTVPVVQLVLSSTQLSEQKLFDLGNNFIRTQLAPVEGAAVPYPYGGKIPQIQVDLNPEAMQAYGVSPQDVNTAISTQNLIIPAGTQKIGLYEYYVKLNASPIQLEELNNLPVKYNQGSVTFVRDVAHVRNGFAPQTNIVRVNGARAVLMPIQKTGASSTLDIINQVKALIPKIRDSMPPALNLNLVSDQSLFVKAAINGVVRESVIAAFLTALMILLFVGNFRSTLIITISIPLSILASIIVFSGLGQTFNIMTLGGLALAVGILVDDATVTIENINWHLEQGKEVKQAILDGANQIALPAFVSTICICIVFVPIFFLQGVPKFLFAPLAEAVIFAMLASYFLSRTLVATLANYWLKKKENHDHEEENQKNSWYLFNRFENHFQTFREHYRNTLTMILEERKWFVIGFLAFIVISLLVLFPWLGSDFFPTVDSGQIKLHVQTTTGTRVEETAKFIDEIDQFIRRQIPQNEIETIVDNIGLPVSGINLSYSNSAPVGPGSADIYISLKDHHGPSENYVRTLRQTLPVQFPGVTFSFLAADMVGQILNFGLPAPIDLQITGLNQLANRHYASQLLNRIKQVSGVVDAHIHQSFNYPQLDVNVNRSFAQVVGITQASVAGNLLISLSGTSQINPTFWLNTDNGVSYPIVTQTPQYRLTSLQDLKNIPINHTIMQNQYQILGALANVKRTVAPVVESHYNVQPVVDIFASVQDRDLGGIAKDIRALFKNTKQSLPKGSSVTARGLIETQAVSFKGLYAGIAFAILLSYLLIVVNFQSWVDPFIIITALPAGLAGIAWMLFITHTTLSVPALMGTIMTMGVATANSILVISFTKQTMQDHLDAVTATLEATYVRLRPVLMTALAMIIGMLPMALGFGEGGEQNAPLGRAVIGGLLFATVATLFFVPSVFCLIHDYKAKKEKQKQESEIE